MPPFDSDAFGKAMASPMSSSPGEKTLLIRMLIWFLPMTVTVMGMMYMQGVRHRELITHRAKKNTAVLIGKISLRDEAEDIDAMVKRADEALYAAKQAGRNCVRLA